MMNTALVGCHDAKDGEEITSSGEITTFGPKNVGKPPFRMVEAWKNPP